MTHMRDAWCAGKPVRVPVKDGPVSHLSVSCPTCGQQRGSECRNLVPDLAPKGGPYGSPRFLEGHASRRQKAEQARG